MRASPYNNFRSRYDICLSRPAVRDNARVEEGPRDRGTGLTSLRRYTWWAVPGTVVCVMVLSYGSWALDGDVPAWARVPTAAALAVEAVASVVLLSGWLQVPAPDESPSVRPPSGRLLIAGAAAVVLAALPLARHDYGLWAVAPAVTVAIAASYLPARSRWLLVVGATILALVPGAAVSLAAGD